MKKPGLWADRAARWRTRREDFIQATRFPRVATSSFHALRVGYVVRIALRWSIKYDIFWIQGI